MPHTGDQSGVTGNQHAPAPGVEIFVETETVDTQVADGAEAPSLFNGSEGLCGVLDQRQPAPPADFLKGVRSCSLSVQVCDQQGPGMAVDQRFRLLRVDRARLTENVGENGDAAGQKHHVHGIHDGQGRHNYGLSLSYHLPKREVQTGPGDRDADRGGNVEAPAYLALKSSHCVAALE